VDGDAADVTAEELPLARVQPAADSEVELAHAFHWMSRVRRGDATIGFGF